MHGDWLMKKIIYLLVTVSFTIPTLAKVPVTKELSQKYFNQLQTIGPVLKEVIEWYSDPKVKQPERMLLYADITTFIDDRLAKNTGCDQIIPKLPAAQAAKLPNGMAKKICATQAFISRVKQEDL